MIWALRIFFSFVLIAMLAVTSWASGLIPLWKTPHAVIAHPWFIATLFDTYFAFLTFYCWLLYRERGAMAKGLWLIAILVLGNIAMASYMLILLFRLPSNASVGDVLIRLEDRRR